MRWQSSRSALGVVVRHYWVLIAFTLTILAVSPSSRTC